MFLFLKRTNSKMLETRFQNYLNLKKEVSLKPVPNTCSVVLKNLSKILVVTILLFLAFTLQTNHQALAPIYFGFDAAQAVNEADRQALQDELDAVNRQIDEYQAALAKNSGGEKYFTK